MGKIILLLGVLLVAVMGLLTGCTTINVPDGGKVIIEGQPSMSPPAMGAVGPPR